MAYTTISNSSSQFKVIKHTGNATDNTAITGVGHQPSIIWSKNMTDAGTNHYFIDSVRGVTKRIYPSSSSAEGTDATLLKSFDTDGYTLGDGSMNQSGKEHINYLWKGGATSGIATNGTTTITPSYYNFNQTNGMSIIKWAGNGVDGAYIPHGLGKRPRMIWVKCLGLSEDWQVYAEGAGNQGRGWLSYSNTWTTSSGEWGSFTPDAVNFKVSNDTHMNVNGHDFVAYCFADITGYQKILHWQASAETDGNFCYCGFKPSFVLLWNIDNGGRQAILDSVNNPYNVGTSAVNILYANSSNALTSTSDYSFDFVSNGFKVRGGSTSNINHTDDNDYVALAIAEAPIVANNNVPCTAR